MDDHARSPEGHSSSACAAALVDRGLRRGEKVGLLLRTEPAFFSSFFGVLLAGGVPVPLYPPFRLDRLEAYVDRQVGILRNAETRTLILFPEAKRIAPLLRGRVPTLRHSVTPDQLAWTDAPAPELPLEENDEALLQYTSGSTGEPKGVRLTHANLLANIRAIAGAFEVHPGDVGVSWLPLYHDMGLIGSWLMPLCYGIPVVLLSPLAFLARPARWLQTLHRYRGTLSAAPNFAFDLCARKISEDELQGLDLSAWRVALNGSEPVIAETVERFTRRFEPAGFRASAMFPAYGLAEIAVALTFPPLGRPPRIEAIDREWLSAQHEARPAPPGKTPLRFVSCGRPLPGYSVRIVDPRERATPERVEGRIEFRGPSLTPGYYRNPEATRAVMHEGWMDSGDLGYLADGELFVTGRVKDLIIKGGHNLYPSELESAVTELDGVRKGGVAAFGVRSEALGTEQLVLVVETREKQARALEQLRAAIVARVAEVVGVPPDHVELTPPGSVKKTSSGKVRRGATREAYVRGALSRRRRVGTQYVRLMAARLRAQGRRGLVGAGGLAYSAYVGAILSLMALPFSTGLWLLPAGARTDLFVRRTCRVLLGAARVRVELHGLENLRDQEPCVLVANHTSYVDALALLASLPIPFTALAKRELGRWPLVGAAVRKSGHVTVERADPSLSVRAAEDAIELLRSGRSLLFYPEGTRGRGASLLPFRLGAFKAAVESGRPVIPLHLEGAQRILPRGFHLLRPGRIRITIGEPLIPSGEGLAEMVRLRDATRAELAGS